MTKRNFILLLTYIICTCIIVSEFGYEESFKISILLLVSGGIFLVGCLCYYLGILSLKEARDERTKIKHDIDRRPIKEQLDEYFGVKK